MSSHSIFQAEQSVLRPPHSARWEMARGGSLRMDPLPSLPWAELSIGSRHKPAVSFKLIGQNSRGCVQFDFVQEQRVCFFHLEQLPTKYRIGNTTSLTCIYWMQSANQQAIILLKIWGRAPETSSSNSSEFTVQNDWSHYQVPKLCELVPTPQIWF